MNLRKFQKSGINYSYKIMIMQWDVFLNTWQSQLYILVRKLNSGTLKSCLWVTCLTENPILYMDLGFIEWHHLWVSLFLSMTNPINTRNTHTSPLLSAITTCLDLMDLFSPDVYFPVLFYIFNNISKFLIPLDLKLVFFIWLQVFIISILQEHREYAKSKHF